MLKKKLRQILKDNNLYHIFIEIKNTLKITRIVTKLLILYFRFFGNLTSETTFLIDRNSFGESVFDYTDALANLKKFLDDSDNRKNKINKFHIYIRGKPANKILDNWFHINMNIIVKKYLIEKKQINENILRYKLKFKKTLFLNYIKEFTLNQKCNTGYMIRSGSRNLYTNRYNINKNYKTLLEDKQFINLETLCKEYLSNQLDTKIKKICKKKIAVFYDYDIDNRKDRFSVDSKNKLKENLYLRYIENDIVQESFEELIKRDYNIVRLGRSNNRFPFKNVNFHDLAYEYSNSNEMESLDFIIPYNSELCITLGSGGQSSAQLYGLPIFYVGYNRLDIFHLLYNTMLVPKKFYSSSGKLVPISKLQNINNYYPYMKSYWDSKKIKIKSPTNSEVKESLLEFLYFLKNKTNFSNLQNPNINKWREFYLKSSKDFKRLQRIPYRPKIEVSFMISNHEFKKYRDFYS